MTWARRRASTAAGLQRRFQEADVLWSHLDELAVQHRLPERVTDALFDAARGLRVRRSTYVKRMELDERTATRDLGRLVDAGLLSPVGQTRGRYYLASGELSSLYAGIRSRRSAVDDPYPTLMEEIRRAARS